jgi:hypothetical protein
MKRFGAISGLRARLLPMKQTQTGGPGHVLDAASRVTTALTTFSESGRQLSKSGDYTQNLTSPILGALRASRK